MTGRTISRLEALSDGVFAIAVTLIALEINVDPHLASSNASLGRAIWGEWRDVLSYVNAFAVILLAWMGHHRMIEQASGASHRVLLANGVVLLLVALFPFPTRILGQFFGTPAASLAVCVYSAYAALTVLSMIYLNLLLSRERAMPGDHGAFRSRDRRFLRMQWVGFAAYVLAALLAWGSATAALGITFLAIALWALSIASTEKTSPEVRHRRLGGASD